MSSDLLQRKATHFLLWRPRNTNPPPRLVIGQLQVGNPPNFIEHLQINLQPSSVAPDVWEIPASECGLVEGQVYHYWFEVVDSNPNKTTHPPIRCTDPTAWTVDWRLRAPVPPGPDWGDADRDPAGVVKVQNGQLVASDAGGETPDWAGDPGLRTLPPNNRLVIYELPTRWARLTIDGLEVGVGTFRDVMALIEVQAPPANFAGVAVLEGAYLTDLGVNALELLPPADSFVVREWGYATSNYFAPDYDLGKPGEFSWSVAVTDLTNLVKTCHRNGIRFFDDVVMAFATYYSYQNINYLDFHVQMGAGDPEQDARDPFGGDLFKYNFLVDAYDPVSGLTRPLFPARQLMRTHLVRWMQDFRLDGIRMDSVVNFGNWDFIQEFSTHARDLWRTRAQAQGLSLAEADERFLVVAEELAVPLDLVRQRRVDGLWNETFKYQVRAAILGESRDGTFEETVRRMIDCRRIGFSDGTQAVNYVTSHDVEGVRNERLFNFLNNNGITDTEKRIKLAFACLLTAVGVPMIFAGEEFADQHDLPITHPQKQTDPVNYDRSQEPWRRRILDYVSRLVKFRTSSDALAINDTAFIHADFNDGKRVVVWQRGRADSGNLVVVVANFSDFGTPDPFNPSAEYVVQNWPATPPGRRWREISQDRDVSPDKVGREPIFPWEAKVYALVPV